MAILFTSTLDGVWTETEVRGEAITAAEALGNLVTAFHNELPELQGFFAQLKLGLKPVQVGGHMIIGAKRHAAWPDNVAIDIHIGEFWPVHIEEDEPCCSC